jgi:environmental stress-induced protein Ves
MPASSTIRVVEVARQPWRNGGGETRALLVRPRGDRWQVRVSVADVDVNGPFSRFPGVQRWFAVLEGAGVVLTIGSKEHPLGPDDDAISFRGDAAVRCRLVDGPTRDLNLMLNGVPGSMRRVVAAEVWRPETRECGLYAITAGACEATAPDEHAPMPAHALRWWSQAPDSLAFAGEGWWLSAGAKEAAP